MYIYIIYILYYIISYHIISYYIILYYIYYIYTYNIIYILYKCIYIYVSVAGFSDASRLSQEKSMSFYEDQRKVVKERYFPFALG